MHIHKVLGKIKTIVKKDWEELHEERLGKKDFKTILSNDKLYFGYEDLPFQYFKIDGILNDSNNNIYNLNLIMSILLNGTYDNWVTSQKRLNSNNGDVIYFANGDVEGVCMPLINYDYYNGNYKNAQESEID